MRMSNISDIRSMRVSGDNKISGGTQRSSDFYNDNKSAHMFYQPGQTIANGNYGNQDSGLQNVIRVNSGSKDQEQHHLIRDMKLTDKFEQSQIITPQGYFLNFIKMKQGR